VNLRNERVPRDNATGLFEFNSGLVPAPNVRFGTRTRNVDPARFLIGAINFSADYYYIGTSS
jgi:hypothetical protein